MFTVTELGSRFPNKPRENTWRLLVPEKINIDYAQRRREAYALVPRERLFPVKSMVTGQVLVLLQVSSGRPMSGRKVVLTARLSGRGTCNNGGHLGGLDMGQKNAWSELENSIPQVSFKQLPFWLVTIHWQPQRLLSALLTTVSKTICKATSITQRRKGIMMSRTLLHMFRFYTNTHTYKESY